MPNNILGMVPFLQTDNVWVNECFMVCSQSAQRNLTPISCVVESGKTQWHGERRKVGMALFTWAQRTHQPSAYQQRPFHSPHWAVITWLMYIYTTRQRTLQCHGRVCLVCNIHIGSVHLAHSGSSGKTSVIKK